MWYLKHMQKQQKIDPKIQHIVVKQNKNMEFWNFYKALNDFPEDSDAA